MGLSVHRNKAGTFTVTLDLASAQVLGDLPRRLKNVLERTDVRDKVVARLFPRAHANPAEDAEYRRLLGDELLQRKLESVRVFEQTLAQMSPARSWPRKNVSLQIRPEDFTAWLGFVNDMRLVIGTELDITEDGWNTRIDPNDPQAEDYFLLEYLGWLEDSLLRACSDSRE